MKKWLPLLLLLAITGCQSTQTTFPKSYDGTKAYIEDSIGEASMSMGEFFYVAKIDDKAIMHAVTRSMAYSHANQLGRKGATRALATDREHKLTVIAEIYHSAPIGFLMNAGDNYHLEGELTIIPRAGHHYVVTGKLSEQYSAVWIEDTNGNIVSNKLEKHGNDEDSKIEMVTVSPSKNTKQRTNLEHFEHLNLGESEMSVVRKLGKPDNIVYDKGNFFTQRRASYIYHYSQLGSIVFNTTGYNKNEPEYVESINLAVQLQSQLEELETKIMTMPAIELRQLAKNYAKQDSLSEDVLDMMAARIWKDRNSEDGHTIDATSWLCKVIAKSGNGRYKQHLHNIAETTSSKKLRKYALQSLDSLPKSDNPYIIDTTTNHTL